jgi:polysaccharide deacetylase 2 family uncharacterized protein YibQ
MRVGPHLALFFYLAITGLGTFAPGQAQAAPLVSAIDPVCSAAAEQVLPPATISAGLVETVPRPRIAIVIDDLGYSLPRGELTARLPGAVTLAVLPHSPHGKRLAELAHQEGKEVMLHTPMSNVSGQPLDEGGLTDAMDRRTFITVLRENLSAVPHVRGVNNHMGSLLTQNRRAMQWLMGELQSRQLYFLDSRTSARSVAAEVAMERDLPSRSRDIFLDNERDCERIASQFALLLGQARRSGDGVGIGHPYPETLHFLAAALPRLKDSGVELVSVSALLSSGPPDSPPPVDFRDYVGGLQPQAPQVHR